MPRTEHLRTASSQLTADVLLYATDAGGRKTPAIAGWGCVCCVSKSLPVVGYDGWPLLGDSSLMPGERKRLGFVFLSGEETAAMFRRAGKFHLWENGFIGEATVIDRVENF
jgi:hypothetical protein